MAQRLPDGSILMADGRIVYANSLIQAQDLIEILPLFMPPPAWPFVSGGGGGGGGGSGTPGARGADGAAGAAGAPGLQGPQGTNQGVQGPQGNQGLSGALGSQGNQGLAGSGAQGFQGFQGREGVQGNQGLTGSGAQGNQGSQGNQGREGVQGNQGLTGSGAQGNQGSQGNQGNQGLQGFQGTANGGAQGFQGFQGTVGAQGSGGGVSMADVNLQKPFFSDAGLMPPSTFKEELYVWPTADFSNLNGGVVSLNISRARITTVDPMNFGWDIGSLKSTVLFIVGGLRNMSLNISLFMSDTLPVAPELPDGSYVFNIQGNAGSVEMFKRSGGSYTSLGSDSSVSVANTITEPTTGVAFYYDDTTNRLLGLLRFGPEEWWPALDITDSSFTTMRYVGLRISGAGGVMYSICPLAIYTS